MPFQVSNNLSSFLVLLRAGLWERDVILSSIEGLDIVKVYDLAQQQACVGLIAAGLEHLKGASIPKVISLTFAGDALQLEQRNLAMNHFVGVLIDKMKTAGISALLVKGQGIAQCYERPLWRACGDVDFLLDESNYIAAKKYFDKIADCSQNEKKRNSERLHLEYYISDWIVELHGSLHGSLSHRMDSVIDEVQKNTFSNKEFRVWANDNTVIYIPKPDNDVIFVFTHILQHLFLEGIGLRQVCDLSRLLWKFNGEIDKNKLYSRLSKMGVVSEWKAFGSLMVDYLGLPEDAMPYYNKAYKKKAERLLSYIIESGNFGHNRDYSHLAIKHPFKRKILIAWFHLRECFKLAQIFPIDAPRFFCRFMIDGIKAAV